MKLRPIVALVVALGLLGPLAAASTEAAERSVRDIQNALADKGFKPGVPDGVWGKRSIAALRAYQTANGLTPTGTADQATIERLFPTAQAVEDQKPTLAGPASENVTPLPKVPEVEAKPLGPIGGSTSSTIEPAAEAKAVEAATPSQQPQSPQQADSVSTKIESSRDAAAPRSPAAPSDGKNSSWNLALVGLAVGGVVLFWRRRKQKRQAASNNGMPSALEADATVELIWDKDAFRVLTEQSATAQSTPPSQGRATSMDAHNKNVTDWIKANASKPKSLSDGGNDDLTDITERGHKAGAAHPPIPSQTGTLLNFHRPKAAEPKPASSPEDGLHCRPNGRGRVDYAGEVRHRRCRRDFGRHVLPRWLPREAGKAE